MVVVEDGTVLCFFFRKVGGVFCDSFFFALLNHSFFFSN